jgi:hypothetical protein
LTKHDELAWIAGSFNRFVRKLGKAVQSVAGSTQGLTAASVQLSRKMRPLLLTK